ncbi:MAG: NAD(P)H-hydrate dehydratase [Clostridia bacterium]|nr:NAD(P)H-hydrate dehydratase [Clostridia bacterium]
MTEKTADEYNINTEIFGFHIPSGENIRIIDSRDIAKFYPQRKRNTNKGDYGSANIVAGSDKYIGAAALAVEAALKSGCGYVKLTTTEKAKHALVVKYPQVIYLDDCDLTSQAIAIGMGCGVSSGLYDAIDFLTKNYSGTLIIDADGLNSAAKYGLDILKGSTCRIILTPHLKEFSRMTGKSVSEISQKPVNYAQEFARQFGVIMLLKGAASIITDGNEIAINISGTTALAKGGSGDMLSGYIAGSVARGLSPFDAAVCSAHTLGISAEISSQQKTDYCATARDILNNLHLAVKRLTGKL